MDDDPIFKRAVDLLELSRDEVETRHANYHRWQSTAREDAIRKEINQLEKKPANEKLANEQVNTIASRSRRAPTAQQG